MSLQGFLKPFELPSQKLSHLAIDLYHTYKHLALNSTDQFLATAINVLPTGAETGCFLAIDVGGSNLRVGFVELLGKKTTTASNLRRSHDRSWCIEDRFKYEKAEDLFAWIGDCIAEVVSDCLCASSKLASGSDPFGPILPVGIAWSFPMIQNSMSEATLMPMGKGFAITSDLNLGKQILAGYSRHVGFELHSRLKLPSLQIAAITNDTCATFASLAYTAGNEKDNRVSMGLIVGTGTNAAIVMDMDDLHPSKKEAMTLPAEADSKHRSLVVNTEWTIQGAADPLRKHSLINRWDVELDQNCEVPGFQPFEYMAGGRYLGELVRLAAFEYFTVTKGIPASSLPSTLRKRNALDTTLLSTTVAPSSAPRELASSLQSEVPAFPDSGWLWDEKNASVLKAIATSVQERSARMVAAAVVGALACAGDLVVKDMHSSSASTRKENVSHVVPELIVAYTGGVISQYPGYLSSFQTAVDHLVDDLTETQPKQRIVLREVLNGGVIGAGVLAGTVWNLPNPRTAP